MKISGSEPGEKNLSPDAAELLIKDVQSLSQEAVEHKVPEQELVKPETADIVKSELELKLRDFFTAIKKKYADQKAGWTPAELEGASPKKLAPIIREFRNILKEAGAFDPDGLIGALVTEAQVAAAKHHLEQEFINRALDHSAMVYNSGLEKFYRYIAKGLEKIYRGKKKAA